MEKRDCFVVTLLQPALSATASQAQGRVAASSRASVGNVAISDLGAIECGKEGLLRCYTPPACAISYGFTGARTGCSVFASERRERGDL